MSAQPFLLETKALCVHRGARQILRGIDLRIAPGEVVGLIGPNGAGKSTLMRAALGMQPSSGEIALAGTPLFALSTRERALRAAFLPQGREIGWPVSVEALIALGRHPHRGPGAPLGPEDQRAIEEAMVLADVAQFRSRPAVELSGGEQARVLIARALAQQAPLLLADEPNSGLDPAHQIALMETFSARAGRGGASGQGWARGQGGPKGQGSEAGGVLVSLHDLSLAARWCTRLVLLSEGSVLADGPPVEVLSEANLERAFGVAADIFETENGLAVILTGRARGPAGIE
ncbi:MAG: ABC transporter ATP-binding protein [Neomegalonema sp.]|nr:ABC transporter ATP-binding protein [Neomegalonema sp.]